MSKIKSFDKNLYPSIYDAIYEIMDKHLLVAADNSIYSAKALEEVCFFLAQNDIQHEYTVLTAPAGAECDEIISLVWTESGAVGNEVWYSRGKTDSTQTYRVNLNISAVSKERVESWIDWLSGNDGVDGIEMLDWEVEEV